MRESRMNVLNGRGRDTQGGSSTIAGATPEQAVEQAQRHYNNTRPAFERLRER
jgi:hypothetical protein